MLASMTNYLAGITDERWRRAIRRVAEPPIDRLSSQPLITAGLVIKAGGSALAKTGAADFYAVAKGVLVKIAAGTDMTALAGLVITATFFNVAMFFVDSAGVVTVTFGGQGATIGAMTWPQFPVGKSLVGYLLITHFATFTGGTTPLDTATTVYFSPVGPFDPTALV